MAAYQLSDFGRAMEWKTWKALGGCGLPGNTDAYKGLGPLACWPGGITLGDIEDVCPHSGRSLARFAKENMRLDDMAKPYEAGVFKL